MAHDRTGSVLRVLVASTSYCIRQPERIHYDLTQAIGVTTVEHIALLIIGGIFALSLIVPVAFIVYIGALILFGDLSDDE